MHAMNYRGLSLVFAVCRGVPLNCIYNTVIFETRFTMKGIYTGVGESPVIQNRITPGKLSPGWFCSYKKYPVGRLTVYAV